MGNAKRQRWTQNDIIYQVEYEERKARADHTVVLRPKIWSSKRQIQVYIITTNTAP